MYRLNDLTIIIPTLGRHPQVLDEVISRISESVSVIVVWDGHTPPPPNFLQVTAKYGEKIRIVSHDRNRGLSAARNTGTRSANTLLCMFVDDDIVPEKKFEEKVVAFHNRHISDNQMMIGCVTWRNGSCATPLTEWFETRTTWNLFHTTQAEQAFPYFAGGFTSFKRSAMDDISFDESFIRYGSEDTEFGYRFFRRGGVLIYQPDIIGIHLKKLDLAAFRRDISGAGYSHGNMLDLHPDVGMDIGYIFRTVTATLRPESLDKLFHVAEEMLLSIPNPGEDEQCDPLIRLITNQCLQQGFIDYLSEKYDGFTETRQHALAGKKMTRETLMATVTSYAPFHFSKAEQCSDPESCLISIEKAIALSPHYAAPRILAFDRALPNKEMARSNLNCYINEFSEHLDIQTEIRIRQRLEGKVENLFTLESMSARDLYFKLSQINDKPNTEEIIILAQAILAKDISHVGARIAWAKTIISLDLGLAKLLLAEARFFLRNRPLHEQKARSSEITLILEEHLR